jgi:hypothetical protein
MGHGGGKILTDIVSGGVQMLPHARTLRKAREQVKIMVATGFSTRQIKRYLKQWALWWAKTVECWQYQTILSWFKAKCWELGPAAIADGLLQQANLYTRTRSNGGLIRT